MKASSYYCRRNPGLEKVIRVTPVANSFPLLFFLILVFSLCFFSAETRANYGLDVRISYRVYSDTEPYLLASPRPVLVAQNQAERRQKRWEQLNSEEKNRIKQRRKRFEELSPDQQHRLKKARDRFRKMDPDERKALREQWRKMSPQERRESLEK